MTDLNELITAGDKAIETRIGTLEFERGYPSAATAALLYDQLDFQRAVQLYIWSLPLMGFGIWQIRQNETLGTGNFDMITYPSFDSRLNILTPNATTPYFVGFLNLAETGPLVVHYPAGFSAGGFSDLWQRPISDAGATGPDKGAGGRYLILGPGQSVPDDTGYYVANSRTNNLFYGFRALSSVQEDVDHLMQNFKFHSHNDEVAGKEPNPPRYVEASKYWAPAQPRGLEYWQRLHQILSNEPHEERDAWAYAFLHSLGIGFGGAFSPDERLAKTLAEATLVGEAMTRALDFAPRTNRRRFWEDRNWELALSFDVREQMDGNRIENDERATWFYEAVTAMDAMSPKEPGPGSTYLAGQRDASGDWLDGGKTYKLVVGPDVPAAQFWSATAYNVDTRTLIESGEEKADVLSKDPDVVVDEDGSIEVWFAPDQPEGVARSNWAPTKSGEGFFIYFRLYGPEQAYFDRTWKLNDIERID